MERQERGAAAGQTLGLGRVFIPSGSATLSLPGPSRATLTMGHGYKRTRLALAILDPTLDPALGPGIVPN